MSRVGAKQIAVHVELDGHTVPVGTAYVTERRGVVSTTFTYEESYLAGRHAYPVSPDLPLAGARHHLVGLPGAFSDSAPDRWGRNLIDKRTRRMARANPTTAAPREVDYLLGVSDITRQGALRFMAGDSPDFLAPDHDVPRLVELPRLLRAADAVVADGDDFSEVKVLLDAGTGSLGGARPKASVREGAALQIAKFPHPGDRWDVMAWEKTALDLAEQVGIRVPRRRIVPVDRRSVLLLDRFDRDTRGRRLGYVSAMSLVGGVDGGSYDYLEVAEALGERGADVDADLRELWLRVLFSVAVNNTDDHLRNHGFLRAPGGWRLAPVFDVNPEPDEQTSATSIGFIDGDRRERVRALVEAAPEFGVSRARGRAAADVVVEALGRWRETATANGISAVEQRRFAAVLDAADSLLGGI